MIDGLHPPSSPISPEPATRVSPFVRKFYISFPQPSSAPSSARTRGCTVQPLSLSTRKRSSITGGHSESPKQAPPKRPSAAQLQTDGPPSTLKDAIDCLRFAGKSNEDIQAALTNSSIHQMVVEVLKQQTTYPTAIARIRSLDTSTTQPISTEKQRVAECLRQHTYLLGCAHLFRAQAPSAPFIVQSPNGAIYHYLAHKDPRGIVNVYHWSGEIITKKALPHFRQGEGSFANVQRVFDIATGQTDAIKITNPDLSDCKKTPKRVRQDLNRLVHVREYAKTHDLRTKALPCLPKALLGWIASLNVMAYIESLYQGDLIQFKYSALQSEEAIDFLKQLGKIMDALHTFYQAGVLHCDIKPENILFLWKTNRKILLTLTDVGLSITHKELLQGSQLDIYTEGYKRVEDITTLRQFVTDKQTKETLDLAHKMEVYAMGITLKQISVYVPMPPELLEKLHVVIAQMTDNDYRKRPTMQSAQKLWLAVINNY